MMAGPASTDFSKSMERITDAHGTREVTLDQEALAKGYLFLVDRATGALITPVRDLCIDQTLTVRQRMDCVSVIEATFVLEKPFYSEASEDESGH